MPIKRRIAKGTKHRITPEAIDAFTAGDRMALHRALGLAPWQPGPLEADTPEPCIQRDGTAWAEAWPMVRELRAALDAAVGND